MSKTKREKLLEKWTFDAYLERSKLFIDRKGILPRNEVMKLQILFAHEATACVSCGATENLTADHVFPVVFLKMLGYPADKMFRKEWYQALCYSCNRAKTHRVEWDNPVTRHILERAMEEKPSFEYEHYLKSTAQYKKMMELAYEKAKLL